MKLSEAIRVAEKAKGWLDRFPEYRAAVDELIKLARTQTSEPTPKPEPSGFGRLLADVRSEVVKSWDEFTESVFDLPPCADDPAPTPPVADVPDEVLTAMVERALRTAGVTDETHDVYAVACDVTRVVRDRPAPAPDPTPAAPKPGDEVPDREAARKLPHGTLVKDQNGMRGLVSESSNGEPTLVRWTDPHPRPVYPVTIVDVNVL